MAVRVDFDGADWPVSEEYVGEDSSSNARKKMESSRSSQFTGLVIYAPVPHESSVSSPVDEPFVFLQPR